MRIGVAGPFTTACVADRLGSQATGAPIGLGGTPVCALVSGLLDAGHEVSVYSLDTSVTAPVRLEGDRVTVEYGRYRPNARMRALTRFSAERATIAQFVAKDRPAVVHAQWTYEFALGALDARPESLVTVHDWAGGVLRLSPDLYRFSRWTMNASVVRRARALSAVSPSTAGHLPAPQRSRCDVIPNIVSERAFAGGPRNPSGELRVACVSDAFGRLKNLPTLLQAFRRAREALPNAQLRMVGSGCGSGDPLHSWARSQGLDGGVQFLGSAGHADTLDLIGESDLLVHPSLEESFGMAVAEAMAAGTPVAAGVSSGGVAWVTGDGAAGELVDVRDPGAMSDAIVRLLTDEARWKAASESGAASARARFRANVVIEQYVRVYERLLAQ